MKNDYFDAAWEKNIYAKQKALNKYPYSQLVSFVFKRYSKVKNKKKIRVLEIGSGAGNNLWFLAREGFSVYGIDASQSAVKFATSRFKKEKLKVEMSLGTFTELPYSSGFFDLCIDRASLSFLNEKGILLALAEIYRVLKKGGTFYSEIYSIFHGHKKHGRKLEDNLWGEFKGGSFDDLSQVFLLNDKKLKELFKPFSLETVILGKRKNLLTNTNEESSYLIIANKP